MNEKNAKGKSAKKRKGGAEQSVLGNLPSTRPARMGRRRESSPATSTTATAKPTPKARATAAKATAAKAKPQASARKPRAAKPKPRTADGPRAVRSGSPSLERPAPPPAPRRERRSGPPKGTELVTTAVQAAGELAQIGASLSARMVKRAIDRLPKP